MAGSPVNMSQVSGHVHSFSSKVVYSDIANLSLSGSDYFLNFIIENIQTNKNKITHWK